MAGAYVARDRHFFKTIEYSSRTRWLEQEERDKFRPRTGREDKQQLEVRPTRMDQRQANTKYKKADCLFLLLKRKLAPVVLDVTLVVIIFHRL